MNILFISSSTDERNEYLEFTEQIEAVAFFSESIGESIMILNSEQIDLVVLRLSVIPQAGILKYINDYFPHIRVIVLTDQSLDDLLSVFRRGKFSVLREPLTFHDLKRLIEVPLGNHH
ncbi:MAG: hypothetical protein JW861_06930 [Bacteroidales bacterium]|nr:hypothetical protein [Bacteroidales bacterium]